MLTKKSFLLPLLIYFYHLLFQSQAKFDLERAQTALDWVEQMIEEKLDYPGGGGVKDSLEFGAILKDGSVLCK